MGVVIVFDRPITAGTAFSAPNWFVRHGGFKFTPTGRSFPGPEDYRVAISLPSPNAGVDVVQYGALTAEILTTGSGVPVAPFSVPIT